MNLDAPLPDSLNKSEQAPHTSLLSEFGGGLGSHLKAPWIGAAQVLTGKILEEDLSGKEPAPETKARLAGEMVADAALFIGVSALLKRVPNISALVPFETGAFLGLISPLKTGEGAEQSGLCTRPSAAARW